MDERIHGQGVQQVLRDGDHRNKNRAGIWLGPQGRAWLGQRYGCALDFRDALKGKEAKPFYLEPYDIVWVPRTTISKVNQWIDQYINKIVPQTGFLYRYSWGRSTVGMETDAYLQDIER